jgi:hypothetical protein
MDEAIRTHRRDATFQNLRHHPAPNMLGDMLHFMPNTSMQHGSSASRVPEPEPPPGIANTPTHRFHPSGHHLGFSSAGIAAHRLPLPGMLEA